MLDMHKQIQWLNGRMDNQGIKLAQGDDESDEEGNWGGVNENEENEQEPFEELSYEDRVLRALEGKN